MITVIEDLIKIAAHLMNLSNSLNKIIPFLSFLAKYFHFYFMSNFSLQHSSA